MLGPSDSSPLGYSKGSDPLCRGFDRLPQGFSAGS